MTKQKSVYFIGIGGIGVSALAQWYAANGWRVGGSDAAASEITELLKAQGIEVFIGHDKSQLGEPDIVIHSAAIKAGNPEFDEAKKRDIKTKLYAEALGDITRNYKLIAITGSHGKSTTTAMVTKILTEAGLDPTVILGTKMTELDGNNFRAGKSEWFVLEADDYDRHFHNYHPLIAAVTNVDREHLEVYQDLAGVTEAFRVFMTQVGSGGTLIVNGQDKILRKLSKELTDPKLRIVTYNSSEIKRHELGMAGEYNQSNAEAAWQVAKALNISDTQIAKSLASFRGVWRRLEELQEGVFSDYAHHPTEIRAVLSALKQANPEKRLICVFQPHQTDRLNRLFDEFVEAFAEADQTILLPLYKVLGRDDGVGKDSTDLVAAIDSKKVHFAPNFDEAFAAVEQFFGPDHIVVFLGAGDIDSELRQALAH